MPKKDYLEGAINHFKHQEIKIIEVEEWGLTGEDAIYVKPFTLLEKSEIFKGSNDNDLTVLIDVIVKKAQTKDGELMFDLESIACSVQRIIGYIHNKICLIRNVP